MISCAACFDHCNLLHFFRLGFSFLSVCLQKYIIPAAVCRSHSQNIRHLQKLSLQDPQTLNNLFFKMRSLILLTLAPALALANDLFKKSLLLPRQGGDAFVPGTAGFTDNCQYPCGDDCLIPSRGDTCCAEGCK